MSHFGSQSQSDDMPGFQFLYEYGSPRDEYTDPYRKRLELKQVMDAAINAGASTHIDIPQVVVIGSQSSGKSSLFEGISGVPLPRNTGTCTRCPIICRMANDKSGLWRCSIGIIREVDSNGDQLPIPEHIPFGPEIDSVDEVCDRIERAQLAILRPDRDPIEFVNARYLDRGEGGFSFNSIVVEISGPEVIDLSFVDLPGIIADDGGASNSVRRVEEMATKYIAKESSLILLVFHCSDDIQNQGAGRLARLYDPEGIRTITVMTKPDLIEPVLATPWREKLRASKHWFCVRQPGISQLNRMSGEEARHQEMEFFQQEPWINEYNNLSTKSRLGTDNLKNYLNKRLLDWIVAKLPAMQDDLRRNSFGLQEVLDQLPEEITDPVKCANQIIWQFSEKLKGLVSMYNFKTPTLVGTCRRRLEKFTDILYYRLFPQFRPFPKAMEANGRTFEEFPGTLPPPPSLSDELKAIAMPAPVYLDEILKGCVIGRTLEMPGNYPYGVQKEYMEASVNVWRWHTDDMVHGIFQEISTAFRDLVFKHFDSIGRGGVVWDIVGSHIELRRANVRKTLQAALDREMTCSLVYGESEYLHYKDIYRNLYQSQHPLVQNGQEGLSKEEEHGIGIMAETRAFYHVAVRRYAEGTAQIVFHDLLLDIQGGSELEQKLRDELGIFRPGEEHKCREFVEPSPDTVKQREDLKKKKELLKNLLRDLSRF